MVPRSVQFQVNGHHCNSSGGHGQGGGAHNDGRRNKTVFLQQQHNGDKYHRKLVPG